MEKNDELSQEEVTELLNLVKEFVEDTKDQEEKVVLDDESVPTTK